MKTQIQRQENVSHTIQSKTKAANQANVHSVLQKYAARSVQRQANDGLEEDLIQGKFETAQREGVEDEEPLQGKFSGTVQREESVPTKNETGIPDNMKAGFENLSGFSFDDVRVHYNSGKPAQLQALAYTQGNQVHIAPGQEKHLGHELGHVVQQKQGRVQPTMQLQGVSVNDDEGLEREADSMGLASSANLQTKQKANHNPLDITVIQRLTLKEDGVYKRYKKNGDKYEICHGVVDRRTEYEKKTDKGGAQAIPKDEKLKALYTISDEIRNVAKSDTETPYDFGPHIAVSVAAHKMYVAINTGKKDVPPNDNQLQDLTFSAVKNIKNARFGTQELSNKSTYNNDTEKRPLHWAIRNVINNRENIIAQGNTEDIPGLSLHGEQRIMSIINLEGRKKTTDLQDTSGQLKGRRVVHIGGTKGDCADCQQAHYHGLEIINGMRIKSNEEKIDCAILSPQVCRDGKDNAAKHFPDWHLGSNVLSNRPHCGEDMERQSCPLYYNEMQLPEYKEYYRKIKSHELWEKKGRPQNQTKEEQDKDYFKAVKLVNEDILEARRKVKAHEIWEKKGQPQNQTKEEQDKDYFEAVKIVDQEIIDEKIRQRAHRKWIDKGQPKDQAKENQDRDYLEAKKDFDQEVIEVFRMRKEDSSSYDDSEKDYLDAQREVALDIL